MSTFGAELPAPGVEFVVTGRGQRGLRGTGVIGHLAAVVIALAAVLALVGPFLAPHDPDAIDLSSAYEGSSGEHLLGLDGQGRDVVSRLLVGSRNAVLGPLIVVTLAMVAGTIVAVAAAWRGGWFDRVVSAILDVLFAFPGILLAVLVAAIFGPSLLTAAFSLAVAYMPYIARLVRGAALRERALPYIAALEIQGQPALRICVRHLVRNLAPLLVAEGTILFGYAMIDLAAVSFIGLGVQPPATDWGLMVATGQTGVLRGYPMEALSAGICIVIVVVAFNLLGERLAERSLEHP